MNSISTENDATDKCANKWTDQEQYPSVSLCYVSIGRGYSVQVERFGNTGKHATGKRYRVTGGNLFGSDSVLCDTAEEALALIEQGQRELHCWPDLPLAD